MRKSYLAVVLLVFMVISLLGACTSKTPDQIASESQAAISLDTVSWSLDVEGGSAATYTRADAEKHEISKMIVSMVISVVDANMASSRKSFIIEGITLAEFLADMGKSDAAKVTFYGTDLYEDEVTIEVTGDLLASPDVKIGWIMNKKEVLPDSSTYVGIFASSSVNEFDGCCSVYKVVIE